MGASDWVYEIRPVKRKTARVYNFFHFAWIVMFLVSCNIVPGSEISSTPTRPSILPGVSTQKSTIKTGEPLFALDLSSPQGLKNAITSLIWLPDGKFVMAGSGGISLYQSPNAGLQPQVAPSFQSQIVAENPILLSASPDGSDLAWVAADRMVVFWETAKTSNAIIIRTSDFPITGLAINPNKEDLAYSNVKGEMVIWGINSHDVIHNWKQSSWLSDLSFSPDGQYLAGVDLASFTATIYTLDGQVHKQLEWTDAVYPSLNGGFFSPNWKKIAWVAQSVVQIVDVNSGENSFLLSHEDAVGTIAWASNSITLASSATIAQGGEINAAVFVWNSDTGKLLQTIPQTSPVQSISFAPDNRSLAIVDTAGRMQIWTLNQ